MTNSTLRSNVVAATSTGDGGALFTQGGVVVIQSSTISGNRTLHSRGAGIFNYAGNVTLTNSTLSGNSAFGVGGGIYNNGGTLAVANSTFSGNSSGGSGGGIHNDGTLSIVNSTLSGNSATGGFGGGIDNGSVASATLTNTIVAGNTATTNGNPSNSPDLHGAVTSSGHNLIGDTSGSSGIINGTNSDIVNNTPLLGALGSNGGPTQTIPLLAGSPAIGHGDITANGCASATVNHKDQRGFTRAANRCAIGAFEPQTATYRVGSLSDTGAMATFAACQTPGDPTCKLRDALAYASSGSDTITFNTGQSGTDHARRRDADAGDERDDHGADERWDSRGRVHSNLARRLPDRRGDGLRGERRGDGDDQQPDDSAWQRQRWGRRWHLQQRAR